MPTTSERNSRPICASGRSGCALRRKRARSPGRGGSDRLRRTEVHQRKTEELARDAELRSPADEEDLAAAADDPFDDDLLRLIFTACHPVLSPHARAALTLRLLCGLTTQEIARAYLASESAVAQRIVRAKRTLSAAHVPIRGTGPGRAARRLASVLEVVYLIFNEGYSATAGERLIRPELMEEALRLGRILAELLPREVEAHGLVAPVALGLAPRGPGPGGARARLCDARPDRAIHAPGRHRRLPRTRPQA
jgi:predicted RNA polymerase sigma factor